MFETLWHAGMPLPLWPPHKGTGTNYLHEKSYNFPIIQPVASRSVLFPDGRQGLQRMRAGFIKREDLVTYWSGCFLIQGKNTPDSHTGRIATTAGVGSLHSPSRRRGDWSPPRFFPLLVLPQQTSMISGLPH